MLSERSASPIPLTVIGGYLGAGKTTLLNRLLRHADRRLAVIVNDFGELGIDAELLAGAAPIVDLPNGCVCCTLGADFREALERLLALPEPPEHVVIEASGVADPAAVAAWGAVPPFEPAGVIVVVGADSVRRQADDRYVGDDVRRQLRAADMVVVTKRDRCRLDHLRQVDEWLAETVPGTPIVGSVDGELPTAVVLGARGDARPVPSDLAHGGGDATDRYVTWSWESDEPVNPVHLDRALRTRPGGVLRMKGLVRLVDGSVGVVQVVGRTARVGGWGGDAPPASSLVAIGVRGQMRSEVLDRWALHLHRR